MAIPTLEQMQAVRKDMSQNLNDISSSGIWDVVANATDFTGGARPKSYRILVDCVVTLVDMRGQTQALTVLAGDVLFLQASEFTSSVPANSVLGLY